MGVTRDDRGASALKIMVITAGVLAAVVGGFTFGAYGILLVLIAVVVIFAAASVFARSKTPTD